MKNSEKFGGKCQINVKFNREWWITIGWLKMQIITQSSSESFNILMMNLSRRASHRALCIPLRITIALLANLQFFSSQLDISFTFRIATYNRVIIMCLIVFFSHLFPHIIELCRDYKSLTNQMFVGINCLVDKKKRFGDYGNVFQTAHDTGFR